MSVSMTAIVNEIDEGVLKAVQVLKSVINDPKTKTTEKITSANSFLKLNFLLGCQKQAKQQPQELQMLLDEK